jgi:transmembrane sensor
MAGQLNPEVIETAATWYVDLQRVSRDDAILEEHHLWLEAHPDHRRAWARVEKLQQSLGRAPQGTGAAILNAQVSRRQTIKTLSLLLMAGSLGTVAWHERQHLGALHADYRTASGERQTQTLADGSKLTLNTNTRVDVNYGEHLRELALHDGEIRVTTAKDGANRPFIVHTPHGSVRALGTTFTVRSEGDSSRVDVLEHAVEIRPADSANSPRRLDAGQRMIFTGTRAEDARPLPPNADAWTRGLLIVSDWPLARFLGELARYRKGFLGCDSSVENLRISGAFHLNDTDVVLDNLANTLPVQIRYLTRYWVRVEAV